MPVIFTSLALKKLSNLAPLFTQSDVPPAPIVPTSRLNLGTEVPIPTLSRLKGYIPVPKPTSTPPQRLSFARPVNPAPLPIKEVAVTVPTIFVLPIT